MRDLRGSKISMIFQDPMSALNPVRSIRSQFDEVFSAHAVEPLEGRRARMLQMFDLVRLPDPPRILDSYPHQLSGGQRQRVMISFAMALNPDLLIADEPTTALDVTTQAQILSLIADLKREFGTAVLFITHDFGVVAEIADDVVVLRHGEVVERGSLPKLLRSAQDDYTRLLVAAIPGWNPRTASPSTQALVAGRGLRKEFGGKVRALDDVTIDLRAGETLGVVGESGSGKSTFAKCLVGIEEPTGGAIEIAGEDITALGSRARRDRRRMMQVVFQDPTASLNPRHTVGRTIADAVRAAGAPANGAEETVATLLEDVRLDPAFARRFPHELSGGQRQRVCIARALASRPQVLIADEALSALDVSVQRQVLTLFRDIKASRDLSILFITHDLRVAAEICDRIVVMRDGRVLAHGAPDEVLTIDPHPYVRQLLSAIPGQRWFPLGSVLTSVPAERTSS
jgi:peptide/nickel transport system ATP-binding protein